MIEVVVAFRDAVMATLMAWGGVDEDPALRDGGAARGPAAKPVPVVKPVDDHKKPTAWQMDDCPSTKPVAERA